MSRTLCRVGRGLTLAAVLVVVTSLAAGGEGTPAKRTRSVVHLRFADAKGLAETLTKHFKGDGDAQVLAEPRTNTLLVNAAEKVHAEVVKLIADLDRRPRGVVVEVVMADVSPKKAEEAKLDRATFRGPSGEVDKRLEELRKKGVVTGLRRFRLTALENEAVTVTTGESKPMVAGMAGGGKGGGTRAITYRDLGTKVTATARLTAEGEAQVALMMQDSRLRKADGGVVLGKDENGAPVYAQEYQTTTLKTQVAAPLGHTAPVKVAEEEGGGEVRTVVLVATRLVDAKEKDE